MHPSHKCMRLHEVAETLGFILGFLMKRKARSKSASLTRSQSEGCITAAIKKKCRNQRTEFPVKLFLSDCVLVLISEQKRAEMEANILYQL